MQNPTVEDRRAVCGPRPSAPSTVRNTATPAVNLVQVTRRFGAVTALDNLSLDIRSGEFFSLLGPSGCGKTTLLRLVAGLDLPDSGTIWLGGEDATRTPAHRRPVNTVFQSYALFPHLDVWENIAFGLRMKKVSAPQIDERVRRVMALVEIEPLARRRPAELSGGQKQRVALARAVVNEPKVLLLDEPLGALDLKLRKQLQIELRHLQRRLGITFVCVTHDQDEAMVLSDRLAVMRDGRIEQLGPPSELYEHPRTRFVSQFLGSCSLLEASVRRASSGAWVAMTPAGELRVAAATFSVAASSPTKVTLAIRPEKIQLRPLPDLARNESSADHDTQENTLRVRVEDRVYVGAETHYELRAGGQLLRVEVMNAQAEGPAFERGDEAMARLPPEALVVLED